MYSYWVLGRFFSCYFPDLVSALYQLAKSLSLVTAIISNTSSPLDMLLTMLFSNSDILYMYFSKFQYYNSIKTMYRWNEMDLVVSCSRSTVIHQTNKLLYMKVTSNSSHRLLSHHFKRIQQLSYDFHIGLHTSYLYIPVGSICSSPAG